MPGERSESSLWPRWLCDLGWTLAVELAPSERSAERAALFISSSLSESHFFNREGAVLTLL